MDGLGELRELIPRLDKVAPRGNWLPDSMVVTATGPQGGLIRQVGRADSRFTAVRRARWIGDVLIEDGATIDPDRDPD